jgi:hypothetical protein
MTSYTGVVKDYRFEYGDVGFPFHNPRNVEGFGYGRTWERKVFVKKIKAYDAITTDDYTFTLFVAPRALIVEAAFLVDPQEQAVDITNYNTYAIVVSGTTLCSVTDAYGWAPYEPVEIRRANTEANRTLAAEDSVTLVITGSSGGRLIHADTEIWVICSKA